MAISHVCMSCGTDLARIRVDSGPIGSLPVVICPRCRAASVRRAYRTPPRLQRRLATALAALVGQLAALASFAAIAGTIAIGVGNELAWSGTGSPGTVSPRIGILAFLVFPIGLGTWLTACFPHWRRPAAWGVFAALVAVVVSLDAIVLPATTQLLHGPFGLDVTTLEYRADRWAARMLVLAAVMGAAALGIPTGHMTRAINEQARRLRWRARRRRFRIERAR